MSSGPATAPRLRFAPSPTGFFHVGSARTALFNWLVARRQAGSFILRIEDTDADRNREEWVEGIYRAMRWLGLDWDELYRQSERTALYARAAEQLFATGHAYSCDCTPEVVQERTRSNATPGYDSFCADRGLEPGPGRALRFRAPDEGTTVVRDEVRGEPTFENRVIEHFVLVRSNGAATFLLANVVDDADMAVTHVVRGEDHLPNTPKYLLLWRALGGEAGGPAEPSFAHLPLLVNEARKKLSKRRDKVALEDFERQGYLPAAMVNFLALLGWAPKGDREFLTMDELVAEFSLADVTPSPAFFDERKLQHFNQHWIAALPAAEFVERARPFLDGAGLAWDEPVFRAMAPLVQERVRTLAEVPSMVEFLFVDEPAVDERDWGKRVERGPAAAEILEDALREYAGCEWSAAVLHDVTAAIGERHGQGLGKAQFPVRVAVTGRAVGPPLFESLEVLGRDRALARIDAALARLCASGA